MSEQERQARALERAHNEIDRLNAELSELTNEKLAAGRKLDEVMRERDAAVADSERLNWLESQVTEDYYRHDYLIQSDETDGIWLSRIDNGIHGTVPMDMKDRNESLRAAIDAARSAK